MTRRAGRVFRAAWLAIGLCGVPGIAHAQSTGPDQTGSPDQATLIEQGRYLAVAGDCMACHTKPEDGKPFALGPLGSPEKTAFENAAKEKALKVILTN